MEADGSPLSSLCMVRAAELFPKPPLEKEDDKLKIPLTECKSLKIPCPMDIVHARVQCIDQRKMIFFW